MLRLPATLAQVGLATKTAQQSQVLLAIISIPFIQSYMCVCLPAA